MTTKYPVMLAITPPRKNYMPGTMYYSGGYFYMDAVFFGGKKTKAKIPVFKFVIKLNEDDLKAKFKDNRPDAAGYYAGRSSIQFSYSTEERNLVSIVLDGVEIFPIQKYTRVKDSFNAFYSAAVCVVDGLSEGKHVLKLKFK